MAGRRMIQDGIEDLFHRRPRKEVSETQRICQGSEDFLDRTRLTLSLKGALHEIEMCVRYLKPQFLKPSGSRQYHISKTSGCLVHEEVDAYDHFCPAQAIGDVSSIRER